MSIALETKPHLSCCKNCPNLETIYCWVWVRKARNPPTFAQSFQQRIATGFPFLLGSANTQSLFTAGPRAVHWLLCAASALTVLEITRSASCLPQRRQRALTAVHTLLSPHPSEKSSKIQERIITRRTRSFPQPPHVSPKNQCSLVKVCKVSRRTFPHSFEGRNSLIVA